LKRRKSTTATDHHNTRTGPAEPASMKEAPSPTSHISTRQECFSTLLIRTSSRGDVLEIASGTGIWTEALTHHATSITALDSSQEMIEQCKTRLRGNPKVRHVHADFYTWIPDRQYDAVTFSFWISHVPSWKLDEFAMKVSNCLRPRGRIFFVDRQRSAMKYELLDSLAEKSHPGPSKTEKRSTSSNTSTRLRKSPNPSSITGSRQESRTRPTTSTT